MVIGEFVAAVMRELDGYLVEGQEVEFDVRVGPMPTPERDAQGKDVWRPVVGRGESRLRFTVIVGGKQEEACC